MIPTEFKKIIKKQLDKVASKDAVFASKYDASDKSIEECCNFIMSEAKKQAEKANALCVADKVVFGWAIHFFDEKEPSKVTPSAESIKKKKGEDCEKRQLSLFDVPGYVSNF